MKQIMNQYGGAIIAGVTMVLLIITLMNIEVGGNKGIFEIAGAMAEVDGAAYGANRDYEKVNANALRKRPQITYSPSGSGIQKGTSCQILNFLKVTFLDDGISCLLSDARAGTLFTFQITKIWNPAGEDITDTYNKSTRRITFEEAGSYTFEILIRDSQGKQSRLLVDIPVDI